MIHVDVTKFGNIPDHGVGLEQGWLNQHAIGNCTGAKNRRDQPRLRLEPVRIPYRTLSIVKAESAQKVQVLLTVTADQPSVPAFCHHLNPLLSTSPNDLLKPSGMKHGLPASFCIPAPFRGVLPYYGVPFLFALPQEPDRTHIACFRMLVATRRMGLSLDLPIVPPRQGTLRAMRLLFGLDMRW